MGKLYYKTIKRKVGLADLKDYPTSGIHQYHMALANYCKGRGVDQSEAIRLMYLKYQEKPQRRELQCNEIENAVAKAYNSPGITIKTISKGQGIVVTPKFVKTSEDSYWNKDMPLPKVEASPLAIKRAIKASPWSLVDMFEDSPHSLFDSKPAEIINMLFKSDELVCCGSVSKFKVLPAREWLNVSDTGDQIVPNPSRVNVGINMNGQPSQHCRDATGRRKYIVVESDDESLSFDEKASVLKYLRDEAGAKLKMAVHSAGKSLHGWFKATGDSHIDWEFMKVACILGADSRMWLPEQLARTPNAMRGQSNNQQKIYYFDPS
jgi:hypothetical protein